MLEDDGENKCFFFWEDEWATTVLFSPHLPFKLSYEHDAGRRWRSGQKLDEEERWRGGGGLKREELIELYAEEG